jgi:signal peptidase I
LKSGFFKEALDWLLHIVAAVIIGFLIVTFVAQITVVNGRSMENTLYNNDRLIIEKISPRLEKIKREDIVTLDVSGIERIERSPIIKRVIGIEGDFIEIKYGIVYVNGNALEENYISGDETFEVEAEYSSVLVQPGHIYVLGDNRNRGQSNDSRNIGTINIDRVIGKAVLRFFPVNRFGLL